jgi:hypothetical protein
MNIWFLISNPDPFKVNCISQYFGWNFDYAWNEKKFKFIENNAKKGK